MKIAISALALLFCSTLAHAASLTVSAIPYLLESSTPAKQSGGALELTATKGTDLYANTDGTEQLDNTARAMFAPVGDFIFSAKISGTFKQAYEGGALIVYADSRHWIKLLFENPKTGAPGVSTTVTKDGIGDDAQHGVRGPGATWLKIARMKQMYVLYTSADGVVWNMVRTVGLPSATPVKVGFSVQSPVGPAFAAQFSDIRFRSATFKDYWQGE